MRLWSRERRIGPESKLELRLVPAQLAAAFVVFVSPQLVKCHELEFRATDDVMFINGVWIEAPTRTSAACVRSELDPTPTRSAIRRLRTVWIRISHSDELGRVKADEREKFWEYRSVTTANVNEASTRYSRCVGARC